MLGFGQLEALSGETFVSSFADGHPHLVSMAALDGDSFILVWNEYTANGFDIVAQHVDKNGIEVGDPFIINSDVTRHQNSPEVAAIEGGGYVVTWKSTDRDTPYVRSQLFDADDNRIGKEQRISEVIDTDIRPSVTGLAGGGYLVTWGGTIGDDGLDVYARLYSSDGRSDGGRFAINTGTAAVHADPSSARLSDGTIIITWTADSDGSGTGIFARRLSADGQPLGTEFLVNGNIDDFQEASFVTALEDGGFVVVWQAGYDAASNIFGQRFGADGNAFGSEFRVNKDTDGGHFLASASALAGGGFVVTWLVTDLNPTPSEVMAQVFDDNGNRVGSEFMVNQSDSSRPVTSPSRSVAQLTDGTVVFAWSGEEDIESQGVFFRRYEQNFDERVVGAEGDDRLEGLAGDDIILGRGGADILEGGLGNDRLLGGSGRDKLSGGEGGDRFRFVSSEESSSSRVLADRVDDFSSAEGDIIDLRKIDIEGGGASEEFIFIGSGTFTGTAGELRATDPNGNDLSYVEADIDGDASADFIIRVRTDVVLSAADFLL